MENVTKKILADKRYISSQDVAMRLSKTILRYNGQPVFCEGPSEEDGLLVVLVPLLERGDPFLAHSSDELLDISSPPLGWANLEGSGGPYYISRAPVRSQRQGLALGHANWFAPLVNRHFARGLSLRVSDMKPIAECIVGKYPPIYKVANGLGGAFDRDWAMVRLSQKSEKFFTLYHKAVAVGTYMRESRTFFFRYGRLTKTRRNSLEALIFSDKNQGVSYGIKEQRAP